MPFGSLGLIPGSITQSLIDPRNLIHFINHNADVKNLNVFWTTKTVKAEENRHGRDLSLKPLPPPISLTEQGRRITSHLKFDHDVRQQRAQVTQEKEGSIIHHSYSILWPDFGTPAQRRSVRNANNAATGEPFSHQFGKLNFQYLPGFKHYKKKPQATGQSQ